jgi:type IV pilus assembly protein PilA
MKKLQRLKSKKGFSLVELLIVIAIMAVLVGVLAPQYFRYVERSRESSDVQVVNNIASAIKTTAVDPMYEGLIPTTGTIVVSWASNANPGGAITVTTPASGAQHDAILESITSIVGTGVQSRSRVAALNPTVITYDVATARITSIANGAADTRGTFAHACRNILG